MIVLSYRTFVLSGRDLSAVTSILPLPSLGMIIAQARTGHFTWCAAYNVFISARRIAFHCPVVHRFMDCLQLVEVMTDYDNNDTNRRLLPLLPCPVIWRLLEAPGLPGRPQRTKLSVLRYSVMLPHVLSLFGNSSSTERGPGLSDMMKSKI